MISLIFGNKNSSRTQLWFLIIKDNMLPKPPTPADCSKSANLQARTQTIPLESDKTKTNKTSQK